jgi:hypothetical protein
MACEDNLLNFRTLPFPSEIPARVAKEKYKVLWGAGDFWIISDRIWDLYDVFISYGAYGEMTGAAPPAHDLIGSDRFYNPAEVLTQNRIKAIQKGKILVYVDVNNAEQMSALAAIFSGKVELFEELGLHNDIDANQDIVYNFLDQITCNSGKINLSSLDKNCDGIRHPMPSLENLGTDTCLIYTQRPTTELINDLKAQIERKTTEMTRGVSIIRNNIGYVDDLNDLNFILSVFNNIQRMVPAIFSRRPYIIDINDEPRLYSSNRVARITIIKAREETALRNRRHVLRAWGRIRPTKFSLGGGNRRRLRRNKSTRATRKLKRGRK